MIQYDQADQFKSMSLMPLLRLKLIFSLIIITMILTMTMNFNAKNVISGGWDLVAVCDIWCHFFTPALSILDIHRDHRHNPDHRCENYL